jgi:hypothetical protein
MRSPSAWLAGCSCAMILAGCGGHEAAPEKPPPIPPAVAQQLAADADQVAALSGCRAHGAAAKLQSDTIAAISQVPARYREQLMSAANDLANRVPACPPPQRHEDKHGHDHDHGHGHGKHKKHDEGN